MMDNSSETRAMLSQAVGQLLDRHRSSEFLSKGLAKPDLWPQMVGIGFPAAEFPAACGGLEVAFADLVPALQQAGRALAATYLAEFTIMGGWLAGQSDAPAALDIMPAVMSGEARIAFASGEYGSGGDIAFTATCATRTGEGWVLRGKKSVVVGGDMATHIIVPARLGPAAETLDGALGLFLLPADAPGVVACSYELYDGSGAADFDLQDTPVANGCLLAQGSEAAELAELALDRGRAAMAHEMVGLLERVSEITVEYVKTRKQFGQPIGAFQTMQHRMADIAMDVELARSCAQIATDAVATPGSENARMQAVSAAMNAIAGCARRAGQSAVQAHGAIALTREYLAGHYFKRLTMLERYLGDADFHLERYVELAGE